MLSPQFFLFSTNNVVLFVGIFLILFLLEKDMYGSDLVLD